MAASEAVKSVKARVAWPLLWPFSSRAIYMLATAHKNSWKRTLGGAINGPKVENMFSRVRSSIDGSSPEM